MSDDGMQITLTGLVVFFAMLCYVAVRCIYPSCQIFAYSYISSPLSLSPDGALRPIHFPASSLSCVKTEAPPAHHADAADVSIHFEPGRGVHVRIRRGRVLNDGFRALRSLGPRLKGRVQVIIGFVTTKVGQV